MKKYLIFLGKCAVLYRQGKLTEAKVEYDNELLEALREFSNGI